jgi:hypothetical protein
MFYVLWLALALLLPAQQPSAPTAPPSSKIWIGRYAEFEEYLRTAQIEGSERTPVGVLAPSHSRFVAGGLAKGAAVKYVPPGIREGFFESYKSEIAAYKLDRMLELDMVPPTVERRVNGNYVSVQLWCEDVRTLKQILAANVKSPDVEGWNRQVNRQKVFDDLVADIDDNQGNLLIDQAWNLIKIDHSRAFGNNLSIPFEVGNVSRGVNRIDRQFFDRIKALDKAAVKREIGNLLEGGSLDAMFSRRDTIVKAFEKLAAQKGANQVFTP